MARKSKRIALLVALSDLNPVYSIAGVVTDHLHMLSNAGCDLVFITTSDFKDVDLLPPNVELRTYPRLNGFISPRTEGFKSIEFEEYKLRTGSILRTLLQDIDVVITHDLLFLDCFLWANWAIREAQQYLPKIKWLHWVHSGPSRPDGEIAYPLNGCYMPLPNSVYCYPNRTDTIKVAEMFDIPESLVRTVFNTVDPIRLFNFHPLSTEIWNEHKLWEADHICIYPTRMTSAKQPHKLIKLMAYLKAHNKKIKIIICNSWSNGEQELEYIQYLKEFSAALGVGNDIVFTSEFKSKWCGLNAHNIQLGVPRQVVTDLMKVSDIFIMPSISETASLVMLEAALSKNFVVVNEDLNCMHEFAGQKMDDHSSKKAMYIPLGSVTKEFTISGDEEAWYCDQASKILGYLDTDKAISYFRYVRKYHNPNWVWTNQLQPLL